MKTLFVVGALSMSLSSFAAEYGDRQEQNRRPNNRQEDSRPAVDERPTLRQRIVRGLNTGRLTQAEYDQLMQSQAELRSFREGVRADGEVTAEERAALKALRKEHRENIRDQRHDSDFDPDKMIESFTNRIIDGVKKQTLTGEEFLNADNKLQEVKALLANAKLDGAVSAEERASMAPAFEELSQLIYKQKHNIRNGNQVLSNNQNTYDLISESIRREYSQQ